MGEIQYVIYVISGFHCGVNEIKIVDVSGYIGPICKGQPVQEHYSRTAWPLNMGPISCPEMSVTNY